MADLQRANVQMMKALGEMRLRGRLEEVECNRLLRDAGFVGPRRRDRMLAGFGRLLVAIGEKLQGQTTPADRARIASEALRQPPAQVF